jgi:hypothetical protein
MTLIEQESGFCVTIQWDRSYGKVKKTTRRNKWRWNPILNAQSWKIDFSPKDLKNAPTLKNFTKTKVKCIVTSQKKLENHIK